MNVRILRFIGAALLAPVLVDAEPGFDRTVMFGRGRSMLPTLPEGCQVVVVRVPFSEVRVGEADGDIVATRLGGIPVFHRAVRRLADGGLVTQGDNNPAPDHEATTERNYIGVIVGFEEPAAIGQLIAPSAKFVPSD